MATPIPVLKDITHPAKPDDIRYILDKLGYRKMTELFASIGIIIQGPQDELLDRCAYSSSWDYEKIKLLRDMYAINETSYTFTGFLIEGSGGASIEHLFRILRDETRRTLSFQQKEDDRLGIVATGMQGERINCKFRYRHKKIKSDIGMFRDIPMETQFWIHKLDFTETSHRILFCVTIQLTTASDYRNVFNELNELVRNQREYTIQVFSLKPLSNYSQHISSLSFVSCEKSNQFMTDLLENPVLSATQIRDIPSIKIFKWDRVLSSPEQASLIESENIEEDLDFHLKDLTASGVSLHKAKTIISALGGDKHAVSSMGIVFQSNEFLYYTNMEFKLQACRLDVMLTKICRETSPGVEKPYYDSGTYDLILWEYWEKLIERYIDHIANRQGQIDLKAIAT